jgi:integrase
LHGGRWVLRRYLGGQTYATESIGTADDNQDADNVSILTFFQAQAKAREVAKGYREAPAGAAKLTVRDAIESYLGSSRGRDQRIRLSKHVLTDEIANQIVPSLTQSALSNWRNRLPQKLSVAIRKRFTTDFRAALNVFAKLNRKDLPDDLSIIIKHGLASEEKAETGARKAQVLTDADLRRLIEAAWEVDSLGAWEGDLVRVIIVLAATGARFSQVIWMTVGDVQESRLMIPTSAKGRGSKSVARYAVPIGPDVVDALRPSVAGRMGHETLLLRPHWVHVSGGRYTKGERGPWKWPVGLSRPWSEILQQAGLPSGTVPYSLRHSSIVRGLRAGLPVRLVAALHDTSTPMIEKHYSAFISDAMNDLAAKAIVPLTSAPVRTLREVTG